MPVAFMSFSAIFQRKSVGKDGRLIIQGMATCLFLCMDVCGGLYGSVSKAPSSNDFRRLSSKQYGNHENISRNVRNFKQSVIIIRTNFTFINMIIIHFFLLLQI